MDAIALSLFASRITSVCDEMGAVLCQAAFSPNIKDRLDYSTAIFDADGALCAQAAHIPVHLGSMAYAMLDIIRGRSWSEGDMLVLNDPFLGGTHLPDVTLVAPVYVDDQCCGFVANRAHHADIGSDRPGSMPIASHIEEEGMRISPTLIEREGEIDESVLNRMTEQTATPIEARGDFSAQIASNRAGLVRLHGLITKMGVSRYQSGLIALNDYAERMARASIIEIPDGTYDFSDVLDDDGCGISDVRIAVSIQINGASAHIDFSGTDPQVKGNLNCPLPVAAASVYYVFRALMPPQIPACAGSMRPVTLSAPKGCLLNAQFPAAVAAGNVETSTRVVDVLLGALAQAIPERIPAASHGSMNNLAMGARTATDSWSYYETVGGGMGASAKGDGLSSVQTHMTNTLNTPVEVLEMNYPLRVEEYSIRRGSGGVGRFQGGDGITRTYKFLQPCQITLLTERRTQAPWGLAGGCSGKPGVNRIDGKIVPGKVECTVQANQTLTMQTPGGGGWGDLNVRGEH